jgi:hypothetical protein
MYPASREWRSLRLLVGLGLLNALPIDHGRWFSAKGEMRASIIVEFHPVADAGASLCVCLAMIAVRPSKQPKQITGLQHTRANGKTNYITKCFKF